MRVTNASNDSWFAEIVNDGMIDKDWRKKQWCRDADETNEWFHNCNPQIFMLGLRACHVGVKRPMTVNLDPRFIFTFYFLCWFLFLISQTFSFVFILLFLLLFVIFYSLECFVGLLVQIRMTQIIFTSFFGLRLYSRHNWIE